MWDAALLLGVEGLGMAASAFGLFALVLNGAHPVRSCLSLRPGTLPITLLVAALVQLSFAVFVASNLTVPQIDEDTVKSFRKWRFTVAHGA